MKKKNLSTRRNAIKAISAGAVGSSFVAQATADGANSGNSDYVEKFKDADHMEEKIGAKTKRIEQGTSMVYWGTEYDERSNVKRHKFTIGSYGESEVEDDNDDRVVTYSEFKWTWEPDTEAYLVDPFPSEIGTKPGLPDSSDPYYDDLIYEVVDASVSIAWDYYGIYSDTQDILDAARNYYEGKKQDQSATYNWYWGEGDTYPVEWETKYHFTVRTEDNTVWFDAEKWHGDTNSRYDAALVGFRICQEGEENDTGSSSNSSQSLPEDLVSKEWNVSGAEPKWYHIDEVPMNHQRRRKRKERGDYQILWGKEPLLVQSYTSPLVQT